MLLILKYSLLYWMSAALPSEGVEYVFIKTILSHLPSFLAKSLKSFLAKQNQWWK